MKDEALGRQLSPRMPTAMTTEMTIWCCGLTPGGRSGTHVIWLTIHQQDSASFSRETQQRHALSYLLAQTVGTRISSGDGWNEATTTCMAQLPLQSTRLNWSRMTCNIGLTSFSMRLTTPGLLRNLHQSTHTHTHTHTHWDCKMTLLQLDANLCHMTPLHVIVTSRSCLQRCGCQV